MGKEAKLLELAEKEFGTLSEAEVKFFTATANGKEADYQNGDEFDNPENADKWGDERVLQASRIEWLCTDREALECVTHRGIRVTGARIDGKFNLAFAKLNFPIGFVCSAFNEDINLQHTSVRALNLGGTHTGGIEADRLKAEGGVFLRNGFKAEGEVRLLGAEIGGIFDCSKSRFLNSKGIAIGADGLEINGNLFLRDGFEAEGLITLVGAVIKSLIYTTVKSPEKAALDLTSAKIGTLWDEEKSWPDKGNLHLHGLVYDNLGDKSPRDAKSRIKWLRLNGGGGFSPQPYEQLAEVLKREGHEEAAKEVLIAKNEDRIAGGDKLKWYDFWGWVWYKVLGPMIGYGYRPSGVLYKGVGKIPFAGSILFWLIMGWVLFGGLSEMISPTQGWAYKTDDAGGLILEEEYPTFQFITYSIDAFVPLVDLQQSKYWLPNANEGRVLLDTGQFAISTGGLLLLYLWLHIAAGWVLTTLLVVGLTGLVRK